MWWLIRWPKYWSFSFNISPSSEYLGLISLKIDWFGLLAFHGTFRSLLQPHSSNASILWRSAFFIVKAIIFPVVTHGCESWTIKKAECQRIDAFKPWCWRRLLRDPWTAKRSNQSILREINPEYSLEGLMLKLKLQYFDHLMWTDDLLEKSLMLGKIEGRRRGHHQCNGHELGQTPGGGEGQGGLAYCSPWGHKESYTTGDWKITTQS